MIKKKGSVNKSFDLIWQTASSTTISPASSQAMNIKIFLCVINKMHPNPVPVQNAQI
jgi:hypothetical protein